ncbi:Uu.00g038930.m01.CDS01 [Anthostomella pinea]|uniref:Uu.00g038930.m01.CDS01 n=1 Tax=Anthostomella pinea TaxID=933095 RepID=A0AAI8VAW5_9PEZI|nr:Uu.00g038930.m01.CDS01 [Anthostomella pinea]
MASSMKLALLSIAAIPAFSYPILSPSTILPRIDVSASKPIVPLSLRGEAPDREIGDYTISGLEKIGEGEAGIVYKGKAKKLGLDSIDVAMKDCRGDAIPTCVKEVNVLQKLHVKISGGVPEVYASQHVKAPDTDGTLKDAFMFIMTLAEGGKLEGLTSKYAQDEKPGDKHSNLVGAWTTLEQIHDAGISHRDIFTANTAFLKKDDGETFGPIMFIDFGQASDESKTKTPVLPSPAEEYAAPEELALIKAYREKRPIVAIDPKLGDVWSFGCVTWELITGDYFCDWARDAYNRNEEEFVGITKEKLKEGGKPVENGLAKWFAGVFATPDRRLTSKQAREQLQEIDANHLG